MKISQCDFQCHVNVSSDSMKLNEQGYKMFGVHNKLFEIKRGRSSLPTLAYQMMFLFYMFKAEICFSCNIFTPLSSLDTILE